MDQDYSKIATRDRFERGAMKTLAAIGLVAMLALGIWGSVQVVRLAPGAFSHIASAVVSLTSIFFPNDRIEIVAPTGTTKSGEPFTIEWAHSRRSDVGRYTFSYTCREKVSVSVMEETGIYKDLACDTAFDVPQYQVEDRYALKIIPTSNAYRYIDLPVTISFIEEGSATPSVTDSITFTLVNESVTDADFGSGSSSSSSSSSSSGGASSSIPSPSSPDEKIPGTSTSNTYVIPNVGTQAQNSNGRADLVGNILEIGYIDAATKTFVASSTVMKNERVAVRFEVKNQGDKTTGPWLFSAVLPTFPPHIFRSDSQSELLPGDRIEYTMGFDRVDEKDSVTFKVNLDPDEKVKEYNDANNSIETTISIVK